MNSSSPRLQKNLLRSLVAAMVIFVTCSCTTNGNTEVISSHILSQTVNVIHKRVFITSTTMTGLTIASIANADTICATRATAGSLGGTWKAWLSTSTTDAISRISDVGPWYNVDNTTLIFPNVDAMTNDAPLSDFATEFGVVTHGRSWTGTRSDGTSSGETCGDWVNAAWDDAEYGVSLQESTSAGDWTSYDSNNCLDMYSIICFEQ